MIPPNDHQHEQRKQPDAQREGEGAAIGDDLSQEFSPIVERLAADGESWQAVLPSGVWLAQLARLLPGAPLSDEPQEHPAHGSVADGQATQLRAGEQRPGQGGIFDLKRLLRGHEHEEE